jgi:ribokinase
VQRAPNIVVVGSANTDMIVSLERLPRPGETLLGGTFLSAAGGKGANQAVAASRAGGRVSLVARLGADALGDDALKGYLHDGIDVTQISRDRRAATGVALIFVARNGENSIAVAGGANGRLSPQNIGKSRSTIAAADVLLMQLETPLNAVQAAARIAAAKGAIVILNPAPARRLPSGLLRHVSILTPNETEAQVLTDVKINGLATLERAALRLRRRGIKTVILTLGARGAYVSSEEFTALIPGFKVKAVDATAAGDVFNGALAVALGEGQPLHEAVRFANAAAAIAVTRRGAQPSVPTRRQIIAFARKRI